MKKFLRLMMIIFMILGIVFSVSNFISVELKSSSEQGIDEDGECIDFGWQCDLFEMD